MSGARLLAVVIGAVLIAIGLMVAIASGAAAAGVPAIPILLFGSLIVITALSEPVYGALINRPPLSGNWRPTGEKFVDPTSGRPVEVWFDPQSGNRCYVDVEGEEKR